MNLFLIDPFTSLLENQVAIRLHQLYGSNVYFYHYGVELDFYVPEIRLAIQVCYSLSDIETRRREVNALLKTVKQLDVDQMMIITKDEDDLIESDGWSIQVVPVWKWLVSSSAK